MIRFQCEGCGQKLSVGDEQSGKRVKCPKCGTVGVVPDGSDKIEFHCESCGQRIRVAQIHAGKKAKCPKCKNPVVMPSLDKLPEADESDLPEESESRDRTPIFIMCGAAAVVVVGLVIVVAVVLRSGSEPAGEPDVPPPQEVMETDVRTTAPALVAQPAPTSVVPPAKESVGSDEPASSSVTAKDDGRKLDLKLHLEPGQTHHLQIIRESNVSQTTEGRQLEDNRTMTTGLEFDVEQVDPNGVAWLKVTYLTIHEISKTPNGSMEYDSTKPGTAVSYLNFGPLFTAMIGQSFTAKVTPEGRIVELAGLAEMHSQMAERVVENEDKAIRQRMAKASAKDAEERARQSIVKRNQRYGSRKKRIEATRTRLEKHGYCSEDHIRGMLGNAIMPFPDGPVGAGDSWRAGTALFYMAHTDLDDCAYTLREIKQDAVSVNFSSKIELNKELGSEEEGAPGSSRTTMTGSCEGSLEVGRNSGWMVRRNVTLHCSEEIKIAPTERTPQGTTVALSMDIATTVKPIEMGQN
jgi:DNA-directed RNA polymerase subunit RPC12/RpoP